MASDPTTPAKISLPPMADWAAVTAENFYPKPGTAWGPPTAFERFLLARLGLPPRRVRRNLT